MDEEKMKQMKEDAERTEITIRELARMTGHPAAVYKVAQIDLQKKLDLISLNMENININEYNELTNIIKQFEEIIDNYISEKNIKLEEI